MVTTGVRVDSRFLLWISPVRKTEASRFFFSIGAYLLDRDKR